AGAVGMTTSRSGIIGLIVVSLFFAGLMVRSQQMVPRLTAALFLMVIVVGTAMWADPDRIAARFSRSDAGGRLDIWHDTIKIARDIPLTGTGLGTFRCVTPYYQTQSMGAAY